MRPAFSIAAVVLLLSLACSRAVGRPAQEAPPVSPDRKPATGSPLAAHSSAESGSVGVPTSAKPQVDGGLPQIQPLTEGKRVAIMKLHRSPPLEVTVPSDMRMTMVDDSDDLLPHALLNGQDGLIVVENPESPWESLTAYLKTKSLDKAEVIHTQSLERGFVAIARLRLVSSPTGYRYLITVSRPDLGVECGEDFAHRVTSPERAQKIASICLSLAARPRKN